MKKQILILAAVMLLCVQYAGAFSYICQSNDNWNGNPFVFNDDSGHKQANFYNTDGTVNEQNQWYAAINTNPGTGFNIYQNDNKSGRKLFVGFQSAPDANTIVRAVAKWNNDNTTEGGIYYGLYCNHTVVIPEGKVYVTAGAKQYEMIHRGNYQFEVIIPRAENVTVSGNEIENTTIVGEEGMGQQANGIPASVKLELTRSVSATTDLVRVKFNLWQNHVTFEEVSNLALNQPIFARDYYAGDGAVATRANDGNTGSSWMSATDGNSVNSWLYVDLGQEFVLNKIVIAWAFNRWPSNTWKLQVATTTPDENSDTDWTDVYLGSSATNPVVENTVSTYNLTPVVGRYVRFIGLSQSISWGFNIREFEVYSVGLYDATASSDLASVLVSPKTVTACLRDEVEFSAFALQETNLEYEDATIAWEVTSANTATAAISANGIFSATATGEYTVTCTATAGIEEVSTNATVTVNDLPPFVVTDNLALNKVSTSPVGNDGNLNTRWRTNEANEMEQWQVDLGRKYVVNNVKILMNDDAGARGATYEIQVSTDGQNWTTVVDNGEIPAGSGQEFSNHIFTGVPARYVKYNGLTNGGWDHNFAEFQVYGAGYYDPAAGDEFESVTIVNAYSTIYAKDNYTFTANAINGKSEIIGDALLTWSVTNNENQATANATINAETGVFTAMVAGTYKIKVSAEADDVTKNDEIIITVDAMRVPNTVVTTFNHNYVLYGLNDVIDFTVNVKDQYSNAMPDATVSFAVSRGNVPANITSGNAQGNYSGTYTCTEAGDEITFTATASRLDIDMSATEVSFTVLNYSIIAKSGWNATASVGIASNAIDNNSGSVWEIPAGTVAQGASTDEALVIDLGKSWNIAMIDLQWEGANPRSYKVYASADNAEWNVIGEQSDLPTQAYIYYRNLVDATQSYRYLKVGDIVAATPYGVKLFEVTAYGSLTPNKWIPQSGSTAWEENTNWSLGIVPTAIDHVIIPVSESYPTIPDNFTIKDITFETGAGVYLASSSITVTGTVSVEYTISPDRWYPIHFPFAIDYIYSEKLDGNLTVYDETQGGHFYLKTYNGEANSFEYASAIVQNEGYIAQFPSYFDGDKIRFVSTTGVTLTNSAENDLTPQEDTYNLHSHGHVHHYAADHTDGNKYYRYNHSTNAFESIDSDLTLPPFESIVSVYLNPETTSQAPRRVIGDGSQADAITGIDVVATDAVISTEYYNLQGVRISVETLHATSLQPAGVYIVKQIYESGKSDVQKIIVK